MNTSCEVLYHIDAYDFGSVDIGGRRYTSDVLIGPEGVRDGWWRKQGHRLEPEDIDALTALEPAVLVVGTGYYGRMEVPPQTQDWLERRGIQLLALPTRDAVREFNLLQQECARVVAALHLTC